MKKLKPYNKSFLVVIILLLLSGTITLISASFGVLTARPDVFWAMMIRHVGFGVLGGLVAMYFFSRVPFIFWKKVSPYILLAGLILTALVFVPGVGFGHGGARRWISLGFISFQPAELLKFAVVVFLSAWYDKYKDYVSTFKYGLLPFIAVSILAIAVLFKQPDSGSILLIGSVSFIIYFISGASWKHIGVAVAGAIVLAGLFVASNQYIIDRFDTFLNPEKDPYGSSYQIRQSRIAIGAGGLTGRGLGQSVHKFGNFLPESNSDSVFAIFAEEYGYIGSLFLISFYVVFSFLGLRIAKRSRSSFARNLTIGIVLLIVIQVFFNIAAISGIVPLSGLPLIFMSNGGTALLVTLAELGIVLNISRSNTNFKRKRI